MLGNDIKAYQKKAVAAAAERALITAERSQKLDLIIHLLSNLSQAVILCGPTGIGKTTMLRTLQHNRQEQWQILLLDGAASVDFAVISSRLCRFLSQDPRQEADLSLLRMWCINRKVLLIIDDAEHLPPGTLSSLLELVESLPELSLLLAMTHDGFHIKRSTDKEIDDCHFIELPPLTFKECVEYLQNLSALPGVGMAFKSVSEAFVADLYQASHGIPGKILAEMPKVHQLHKRKSSGRSGFWLGTALAVSCAVWGWFLLQPLLHNQKSDNNLQQNVQTIAIPPLQPAVATQPEPEMAGAAAEPVGSADASEPVQTVADTAENSPQQVVAEQTAVVKPEETPMAKQPAVVAAPAVAETRPVVIQEAPKQEPPKPELAKVAVETKPEKSASQAWIKKQPEDNYTLQVMVLSDKDAVNRVYKKYPEYTDNLKFFVTGKQKYVVIYGSFPSLDAARKHKSNMPNEFNRSLEKRFKFVQLESR
jgi:DamX protein